jgi:hypothetical protein
MNQPILIILLLAASISVAAAEEKKIYKYTDENGVTHYSETKPNDNYEEADLPELSVVPSITPRPAAAADGDDAEATAESLAVTNFELLAPTDQQNLWGTGLKLNASVTALTEAQQQVYLVQFVIDGQAQKAASSSRQTFENIYRGTHTLQARLLNKQTSQVIKQTPTITFYMHQNSKK